MTSSPGSKSWGSPGYTIVELLVVIALLAMLAGLGIGTYQNVARQNVLPAAASSVSSTIRAARNYSVSAGLPSKVFIEPESHRVAAFGYELVAAWGFEDLQDEEPGTILSSGRTTVGAFREPAETSRNVAVGEGRIGRCVGFPEEGGSLTAPGRPRYRSPQGFSLEAWVQFRRRSLETGEGVGGAWNDPRRGETYAVVSLPGSWELGLLGDGSLYGVIGDPDDSDAFIVGTASAAVLDGRWTHVRVSFDGVSFLLEVDGVSLPWRPYGFELVDERDWPELPTQVPEGDGDLIISHPARIFIGWIDEVKVRVAREPNVVELPFGVIILGESRVIHFDSRGALDPVQHSHPIQVVLGEQGGEGAFAEEEEPPGRGTVAPPPVEGEVAADGEEGVEADDPAGVGDPVESLARYFEEIQAHGEESRREDAASLELTPGEADATEEEAARAIRRTHRIIIDLTGTIRG